MAEIETCLSKISVLADAAGDAAANSGSAPSFWASLESSLPFLIIMVLLLFIMWFSGRKQRKMQKEMQERKKNLKNGDRVMMTCGIFGVVKGIDNDLVTIAVGPEEVKLVFTKDAIASVDYDSDKVDYSREQAKNMDK